MISFIFGLICATLALVFLALLKTYQHVPIKEMKRLARRGDPVASLLYRPVAYGLSLQILLWLVIGLALAGSVVLFSDSLPAWLAVIFVAVIIWVGFAWIPRGKLTKTGLWLARHLAPPIAWLLERLHPVFSRAAQFVRTRRPVTIHTGLYQKSDLADMLTSQKNQADNRIPAAEIDLLTHALTFGDKLVSDALIPKRVVVSVNADEPIGPIVMEELHKSGHSRFPVYEGKHDNIIGILYLRDLINSKRTGKVRDVMKAHLSYVHEDFTLYQTLQAFLKTKRHLFLVVNNFEELVGIITIEDVLERMIGKLIVDEFDNYDDLRAVAAVAAKQEHALRKKANAEPAAEPTEEPTPTPEAQEVVK